MSHVARSCRMLRSHIHKKDGRKSAKITVIFIFVWELKHYLFSVDVTLDAHLQSTHF